MTVEQAIPVIPIVKLCPCGKTTRNSMDRIRRTRLMKVVLFWLPFKRYNCYQCKHNRWIIG